MKLRLAKKVFRNVSAGRMPRIHTHQEAFRRVVVTAARRAETMWMAMDRLPREQRAYRDWETT